MPSRVENCYRWIVMALFASIFLSRSALVVTSSVTLALGIWLIVTRYRREFMEIPLLIPLLFFFAAILISIAFAAPYPYGGPLGKLRYLLLYFPLTLVFLRLRDLPERIRRLSVWLAILMGVVGVLQFFGIFSPLKVLHLSEQATIPDSNGKLFHATGFLIHHVFFAYASLLLYHLLLGGLLARSEPRWRTAYAVGTVCAAVAIGVSFSRGAWLATGISTLVLLLILSPKRAFTVLASASVGVLLLAAVSGSFRHRMLDIRPERNPERLALWRISWQMFKDAPFTGQGFHSFATYRNHYMTELDKVSFPGFPWDPHSLYLDLLGGTGLLGFGAFLWVLLAAFANYARLRRALMTPADRATWWAALGSFFALLVANATDTHLYSTYGLAGSVFLLAMGQAVVFRYGHYPQAVQSRRQVASSPLPSVS